MKSGYLDIRAPFNRLKVESAEDLWSHFLDYRRHSMDNPIIEPKLFNSKEGPVGANLDKIRPLTLEGLCNFIGMHPGTWANWKRRELEKLEEAQVEDPDAENFFLEVLLQIENIIYDNQYQGAAVDIFNANVVSRKLGLADRRELSGNNGKPLEIASVDPSKISTAALEEVLAARAAPSEAGAR